MNYLKNLLNNKIIIACSLFILVFITDNTLSQGLYWSYPIPITDSVSDNRNPNFTNYFIFWEKSVDTLSTAIYMGDLYTYYPNPRAVLSTPGINFKNPQFVEFYGYPSPDTLFYMFYEIEKNEKFDIYYKKYSKDGNFSEPIPFFPSLYNKKNLRVNGYEFVWEENNKILFSRLIDKNTFSDPIIIDQSNCHNPVIADYAIAYEKIENDSSHIYCSLTNTGYSWSSPLLLFSSGNNTSLSFLKTTSHSIIDGLVWENFSNNLWKIYSYDFHSGILYDFGIQSNKRLNPKGIHIDFISNKKDYADVTFLTYNNEEENNMEIFVNSCINPVSDFQNISNKNTIDIKPNFLFGGYYIYNIWESFNNNHWVLYFSKTKINYGNIQENDSTKNTSEINVYPNPFVNNININLKIKDKSKVRLSIYNSYGSQIKIIYSGYKNKGNYNYKWNGKTNSNFEQSPGVYFVVSEINNFKSVKKIILMK